jgi:hypothetical protein
MAVSANSPAPYAPASAIIDIIGRYRNKGLTRPFTADVLGRAGVSDSLIPRTLQTLLTLDLIAEDGNPTETLEGLRRAPETEFKPQMVAWLKSVYADVFNFAEPTDDETTIRDAFRSYNPVGQQPRMVALFIGLCRAAGLRPDDSVKESRPRINARKASEPSQLQASRRSANAPIRQSTGVAGLPAPLAGLLQSLPADRKWTKDERDKFVQTFQTVLDYCVAIVKIGG